MRTCPDTRPNSFTACNCIVALKFSFNDKNNWKTLKKPIFAIYLMLSRRRRPFQQQKSKNDKNSTFNEFKRGLLIARGQIHSLVFIVALKKTKIIEKRWKSPFFLKTLKKSPFLPFALCYPDDDLINNKNPKMIKKNRLSTNSNVAWWSNSE